MAASSVKLRKVWQAGVWRCLQKREHTVRPANVKAKLVSALRNYRELNLVPLKILQCSLGERFSKARFNLEEFASDNVVYHDEFSKVFERGFTWLKKYVDSDLDICTESGEGGLFYAYSALSTFLYELEYHESCLKDKQNPLRNAFDKKKDGEVAALFANHLLSRLVHRKKYIISNDYQMQPSHCPCLISCLENIQYGQIGLGYEDLWFGHPDIILFSPQLQDYIPLKFSEELPEETFNEDKIFGRGDDTCETKPKNRCFDMSAEEFLSQAITFAFYQSNISGIKGSQPMPTVVPSLMLTPNHYYIVMYDYKNDILLSSGQQASSLWDESEVKFNLSAILQIWMVLNYTDFLPSLGQEGERFFRGSCNFHKILQGMDLFVKTKQIAWRSSFQAGKVIHNFHRKNFRAYIKENKTS